MGTLSVVTSCPREGECNMQAFKIDLCTFSNLEEDPSKLSSTSFVEGDSE